MDKPGLKPLIIRNPASRAAIVFIHGFTGSGSDTWSDIGPRLTDEVELNGWDGWLMTYKTSPKPDLLRRLWSADASIDKLALRLVTDISEGSLSDYDSLVLIAHSMGGLVVQRALLNSEALADKTHAVILYGTPSGGLSVARRIKGWKRQIADMAEGGEFITRLRSDWSQKFGDKPPFFFLAVAGENDEFVPDTSSLEPFAANTNLIRSVPGNHTSMIHPSPADATAIDVAKNCILGKVEKLSGYDAVRFALERGEFRRVVSDLEPSVASLDKRALVSLAIALDALGERDKAEQYLQEHAGDNTDAMGTLAGRLKRQWLLSDRSEKKAEASEHYYRKGFELAIAKGDHAQTYYLGINLAFLAQVFREDRSLARDYANKVLTACDAALQEKLHDDWMTATQGEASLILGDTESAFRYYEEFVGTDRHIWQVASAYLNAKEIAATLGQSAVEARIDEIFMRADD